MEDEGRKSERNVAKYLLDWVVRGSVIIVTILSGATFAHIRALSDRSHSLELRLTTIESSRFTSQNGQEVWKAIAERPTRDELQQSLSEIKEMIRDLDRKVDAR